MDSKVIVFEYQADAIEQFKSAINLGFKATLQNRDRKPEEIQPNSFYAGNTVYELTINFN